MDIGEDYSHLHARKTYRKKRKIHTDGLSIRQKDNVSLAQQQKEIKDNHQNNTHALLLGGERAVFFMTNDSRRYITTEQERQEMLRNQYVDVRGKFDSVHARYQKQYTLGEKQYELTRQRIQNTYNVFASYRNSLHMDMSPMRMWQVSLTGAMIFGMVSMSLIYNNLGQSAFASDDVKEELEKSEEKKVVRVIENVQKEDDKENVDSEKKEKKENAVRAGKVDDKKVEDKKTEKTEAVVDAPKSENVEEKKIVSDIVQKEEKKVVRVIENVQKEEEEEIVESEKIEKVVASIDSASQKKDDEVDNIEEKIEEVRERTLKDLAEETVDGYPIEKMLPYILEQDPEVAKYLIAIAKQESGWGKRVPVLNGQDCYNYWGYRGIRKLMGSGGHTCFNSRKDAVETVGRRIHELIYEYDRKTAERLIVWKCGSTCAGHSQAGVDRWIGTVDTYYDRLSKK